MRGAAQEHGGVARIDESTGAYVGTIDVVGYGVLCCCVVCCYRYVYICMCVYIYIYIYTHTHIYYVGT